MTKNRSRKRALRFERLESKSSPAALLLTLAPLDDHAQAQLECSLPERLVAEEPASHWQFTHSVVALLRFVDEHSLPVVAEPTVCSPPTWDECRVSDEMMLLRDHELRAVVIAENFGARSLDAEDLDAEDLDAEARGRWATSSTETW